MYLLLLNQFIWFAYEYYTSIDTPLRLRNIGFVASSVSLTWWKEVAYPNLVGHPSRDGVLIKIHYGADVYYINQPCTPCFP